jgi:hypothetical protein
VGLAVAGVRLLAASARGRPLPFDAPADYLLSLPLVLTFFLIGGLRAAFAVPTDTTANWTFRVSAGRSPEAAVSGTRAALWVLGVLPVSLVVLAIGGWSWGLATAAATAAMHALSGVFLCELAVLDCHAIPFTRGRGLNSSSIKVQGPLGLIGLHLYAFRLDDLQLASLGSTGDVAIYLAAMVTAALLVGIIGRRRRRPADLAFDAPSDQALTPLSLSGASG